LDEKCEYIRIHHGKGITLIFERILNEIYSTECDQT
jgi:hypothetical protein